MKTKLRQLIILSLFMMFALITVPASANDYELKDVNGKRVYAPMVDRGFQKETRIYWDIKYGKLVKKSLKYNKKKVTIGAGDYGFGITPKKATKSNISFKLKKNGKTKTYSIKVQAFKLDSAPFSSFKFGSKRLDLIDYGDGQKLPPISMFNYGFALGTEKILRTGADSGKFKIKLREGWSIKSAVMHYKNGKTKNVSLSKKIKIRQSAKYHDTLNITFVNQEGNEVVFRVIGFMNN